MMDQLFCCMDCGNIFTSPVKITQHHNEIPGGGTETFEYCSACKSDDFIPVPCDVGDMLYHVEESVHESPEGSCIASRWVGNKPVQGFTRTHILVGWGMSVPLFEISDYGTVCSIHREDVVAYMQKKHISDPKVTALLELLDTEYELAKKRQYNGRVPSGFMRGINKAIELVNKVYEIGQEESHEN